MHATIIGIDGGMGQWMKQHLTSLGYTVSGFDERRGDNPSIIRMADLVIVSVPISATAASIKKTVKHMKPGACLMEIASLKTGIIEAMQEATGHGFDVLCVHPMFGPSTKTLNGKSVAVVPVVDIEKERTLVVGIFPSAAIEVVDAEEHDRLMSVILSLPYLINLALADTIKDMDLGLLGRLAGTTFLVQYVLAQSVSLESTGLVSGLLSGNRHLEETAEKYLERIRKICKTRDNEFQDMHKSIRDSMSLDPSFKESHMLRQAAFESIKSNKNQLEMTRASD